MTRFVLALALTGCSGQAADARADAPAAADVAQADEVALEKDAAADSPAAAHDAGEVLCSADCEDGNPCTNDLCITGLGCAHIPHAGACDDGDPCTAKDSCQASTCSGTPLPACP